MVPFLRYFSFSEKLPSKANGIPFSQWEIETLDILQYTMWISLIAMLVFVLIERKSFWFLFFKRAAFAAGLSCFALMVALQSGFMAAQKVGWDRSVVLIIFTFLSYAALFLFLLKSLPLLLKKEKLRWHWVWIPLYFLSFFAMGLVQA